MYKNDVFVFIKSTMPLVYFYCCNDVFELDGTLTHDRFTFCRSISLHDLDNVEQSEENEMIDEQKELNDSARLA